jgi:endonuclease-3 related protein
LGKLASNYGLGGTSVQKQRLSKEGIDVSDNKVDLKKHLWRPNEVLILYFELLKKYGQPQAWPWFPSAGSGQVLSKSTEHFQPHSSEEIVIGAILTQRTNWRNVELALENLKSAGVFSIYDIYKLGSKNYVKLTQLIKPSGFYNQKAKRLFEFCKFITKNFKSLKNFFKLSCDEARQKLLSLSGIGKETADTILLYAGNKPIFVIDAYTQKFAETKKLNSDLDYDSLQEFFIKNLPKNVKLYQDFHALIIKCGKEKS